MNALVMTLKNGFMEIILFSQCIQQHLFLGKNASIRRKLPTAVCWSQEKEEEGVKSTCFISKAGADPGIQGGGGVGLGG